MQARTTTPKLRDAKKLLDDEKEKERVQDRELKRPRHFHATVYTFVSKDDHGNFVDSTHHEVMGLSVDACVRKAIARGERRHEGYHVAQISECSDTGHSANMAD